MRPCAPNLRVIRVTAYLGAHRVLGSERHFWIFVDEDSDYTRALPLASSIATIPGDLSDEALTETCKAMGFELTEIIRTTSR